MPRNPVPPEIDPYDEPVEADIAVASAEEEGEQPESRISAVATLGVLLDEKEEEEDPWAFANLIVEHNVGREFRQGYLERWFAMVSEKAETERDALLDHGRVIFRYRLETARKRIKEIQEGGGPGNATLALETRETTTVLHPAHDVHDNILWYGVPTQAGLIMVNSATREPVTAGALGEGLVLKHQQPGPCQWSRDSLLRYVQNLDATPAPLGTLLDDLADFVRSYVAFDKPKLPLLIACWLFGTYIHRGFRVFPYLQVRSPEKRCGKTRLLELLAAASFNSTGVMTKLTEAAVFRLAGQTAGTQVVDELEYLDNEITDGFVAVLNSGFQRGGFVPRIESRRSGEYENMRYETFAPRAIAAISALRDTLEDRSLPVYLNRKKRDAHVQRLRKKVLDAQAATLRDRCYTAALRYFSDIMERYESEAAVQALEALGLDDRAVDLWESVVTIAAAADVGDQGTRRADLLVLATELRGVREADDTDSGTATLLRALVNVAGAGNEKNITPTNLLQLVRSYDVGLSGAIGSTKKLAERLRPLGLVSSSVREPGTDKVVRKYTLESARLAELLTRYEGVNPPPPAPSARLAPRPRRQPVA